MYDVNSINSNKEKISAIVDGEECSFFVLDQDVTLNEEWKNYHLIGDALRGEKLSITDSSFADAIMAQIENEPAYNQQGITKSDNVEPLFREAPQTKTDTSKRWLSQFTQIGVAASVAVAVVLGVQSFNSSQTQQIASVQQPQVLNTIPFTGSAEPVSLTRDDLQTSAQSKNSSEAVRHQERQKINALLQDYELQLKFNHVDTVNQVNQ